MILVAGYSYIRENFLDTFRGLLEKGEMSFLLPKTWKAKGGRVIFHAPHRKGVLTTKTFFYHSHYPLVGGLFKGWMPLFPLTLWHLRHQVNIVYSPSEPTLLTTLYQGVWTNLFGKRHIIFTWENVAYREKFSGLNLAVKEFLIHLNCFFADGVICGNRKAQEIIRTYADKPTAVIPLSGVDTDFFSPDKKDDTLQRKYGLEGKFIFSFIGALGYRKGIHIILSAFHALRAENENVHLIIAGSGEYEKEIGKRIAELGPANSVIMIPWADPNLVRKILSVTDVFLYPSIPYRGWEEQFGYSIAEAMAMAVPVISTRSGSIPDLIEEGKNGILIKPNDGPALEGAMRFLIRNEQSRTAVAHAAREKIIRKYAFQKVAEQYQQFFSRIADVVNL